MIISIILGALLLILCIYIFLISPSWSAGRALDFFEKNRHFAHRGLHGDGIPENSLAAFRRACEAGYGIELDVHLTADEKLVVFHDDTLTRMCGTDGTPEEKTLAELQELSLAGTDERIPSFDEVLALVSGRVPLIVELKGRSTKDMRICKAVSERMKKLRRQLVHGGFQSVLCALVPQKRQERCTRSALMQDERRGRNGKRRTGFQPAQSPAFVSRASAFYRIFRCRQEKASPCMRQSSAAVALWAGRCEAMKKWKKACGFNAVIFEKDKTLKRRKKINV